MIAEKFSEVPSFSLVSWFASLKEKKKKYIHYHDGSKKAYVASEIIVSAKISTV